jgi:hypothetical protein
MRHLRVIATIIAMSSSAPAQTVTDKAQHACGLAAYKDYLAAGLALNQSDPLVNSVETIVAPAAVDRSVLRAVRAMPEHSCARLRRDGREVR